MQLGNVELAVSEGTVYIIVLYVYVHLLHQYRYTGGFSFPRKGWTVDEWGIGRLQPFTVFIHKIGGARVLDQLHRYYYRYRSAFPRTPLRRQITYHYYYYKYVLHMGQNASQNE